MMVFSCITGGEGLAVAWEAGMTGTVFVNDCPTNKTGKGTPMLAGIKLHDKDNTSSAPFER
jgi:hypothetical protein